MGAGNDRNVAGCPRVRSLVTLAAICTIFALASQRPGAFDPKNPTIQVGWNDELNDARTWAPPAMENRAHVAAEPRGQLTLWLNHVPNGWPYTFQWRGLSKEARVDVAKFPVLMARVGPVKGYAHMDIDVLDASGKAVKTLRTSTLNGPGLSTIDLKTALDPAVYHFALRLIVGGDNSGCSAVYNWVRFVGPKDAEFLTAHPDYNRIKTVPAPPAPKAPDGWAPFEAVEICASPQAAGVNDDDMVAGITVGADGKREAFVWSRGRIVWRAPGFDHIVGPNAKGQVALGNDKGMYLWDRGKLKLCENHMVSGLFNGKPIPNELLGIDDKGTVIGLIHGLEGAYAEIVWPKPVQQAGFGSQAMPPSPGLGSGFPVFPPFYPTAMGADGSLAGTKARQEFLGNPPDVKAYAFYSKAGDLSPIGDRSAHHTPLAISSSGEVVGQTQAYRPNPFWWRAGTVVELPLPNEDSTGTAVAINVHSKIVGKMNYATFDSQTSRQTGYTQTAAVWVGGHMNDLNGWLPATCEWRLTEAWAVNERGDILAVGYRKSKPGESSLVLLRVRRP